MQALPGLAPLPPDARIDIRLRRALSPLLHLTIFRFILKLIYSIDNKCHAVAWHLPDKFLVESLS